MAERAMISRVTLNKVERASRRIPRHLLHGSLVLGQETRIAEFAAASGDAVELEPEDQNLPKRIRFSRKRDHRACMCRRP
jgi:plasmid stability protein